MIDTNHKRACELNEVNHVRFPRLSGEAIRPLKINYIRMKSDK
jgi:hypothetical protein